MYVDYLQLSFVEFLKKYAENSIGICKKLLQSERKPERLYIGNQFCHLLFPEQDMLFKLMEQAVKAHLKITLVFSYVREYKLDFISRLLCEIDKWCRLHNCQIEVVVNDWGMAEILKNQTENLIPCLGTLLNKRKKDPRMKYKSGDTLLFPQNSLNAGFYRGFLAEEFHIHRYEWESCGYPQELPPGKNSLHLPFYQTNTSQYCPLYALCTTGDRGTQQLAEHCPKFCEKYALLYPEHLHMAGRYNSLFGVDKTLPESTEMWKNIKGTKPDRIVVNI